MHVWQEAREAALTAKKSEHLREEASLALEAAREELKACRLVVDEASEAGRLREQVGDVHWKRMIFLLRFGSGMNPSHASTSAALLEMCSLFSRHTTVITPSRPMPGGGVTQKRACE